MDELTASMDDGARIVLRRYGPAVARRVFVCHGVGLAIDAFADMWRDLAADHEVIAFDMRCHGRNPAEAALDATPARFGHDMLVVLDAADAAWGKKPAYGLFHSASGIAALRAALADPGRFAALMLLEPPFAVPPGHVHHDERERVQAAIAKAAAERRYRFNSPEEHAERLGRVAAFKALPFDARLKLARATLRREDDSWTLACPREFEARMFALNAYDGLFERLSEITARVLVVVGDDRGARPAIADDAARRAGFHRLRLAGAGHMMPMERPIELAANARLFFAAR